MRTFPAAWLSALLAAFLVACGGSGGSAPGGLRDSFGQSVGAAEGFSPDDAGVDGTVTHLSAGPAAPLILFPVQLTDAAGHTASTTTDLQGYYRLKVTGFTPPFVVTVWGIHSVTVQPPVPGAFQAVNVSALTDKIASDVARSAGMWDASQLTPGVAAEQQATLAASRASLRTQLASLVSVAGLDPGQFDPIATPFRADHPGYQMVLERAVVVPGSSGGAGVEVHRRSALPALPGFWEVLGTLDGNFYLTGGGWPGDTVPTEDELALRNATDVAASLTDFRKGTEDRMFEGNTVRMRAPGNNYTLTVESFAYSGYEGCGSCEVGSTVKSTLRVTMTRNGVIDGIAVSNERSTLTLDYTYRRRE